MCRPTLDMAPRRRDSTCEPVRPGESRGAADCHVEQLPAREGSPGGDAIAAQIAVV